jgi:hypothetical protein
VCGSAATPASCHTPTIRRQTNIFAITRATHGFAPKPVRAAWSLSLETSKSALRSNEFVFTMALLASAEHRRKNKRKSVCN